MREATRRKKNERSGEGARQTTDSAAPNTQAQRHHTHREAREGAADSEQKTQRRTCAALYGQLYKMRILLAALEGLRSKPTKKPPYKIHHFVSQPPRRGAWGRPRPQRGRAEARTDAAASRAGGGGDAPTFTGGWEANWTESAATGRHGARDAQRGEQPPQRRRARARERLKTRRARANDPRERHGGGAVYLLPPPPPEGVRRSVKKSVPKICPNPLTKLLALWYNRSAAT